VVHAAVLSNPLIVAAVIIACPTYVDVSSIAPDTFLLSLYFLSTEFYESKKGRKEEEAH